MMSLLPFPWSVSATKELDSAGSNKTSGQSTKKGGNWEMLTQSSPAMKTHRRHVCCLVDILAEYLEWARALLQRALLQTSILRLFQKQDFNL